MDEKQLLVPEVGGLIIQKLFNVCYFFLHFSLVC